MSGIQTVVINKTNNQFNVEERDKEEADSRASIEPGSLFLYS